MKKALSVIVLLTVLSSCQFLGNKDASPYYNSGVDKADLEDYRGAIQDYNKAIELDPEYVSAYINRGFSKKKLGDNRGAIQDYDKAIEFIGYSKHNMEIFYREQISFPVHNPLFFFNGPALDRKSVV